MSIYPDHYHRELDRKSNARHKATEAITEIYCERDALERFMADVREDARRNKVDIIYGTITGNGNSATVGIQKDTGSVFSQFECNSGGALPKGPVGMVEVNLAGLSPRPLCYILGHSAQGNRDP